MKTRGARRRDEATKKAILDAYLAGEKTTAIACLHGVSPSYPTMLVARLGIPRRQPGMYRPAGMTVGASK